MPHRYECQGSLVIVRESPRWLVHELTMELMHSAEARERVQGMNADEAGWAFRSLAAAVDTWYRPDGADWGDAAAALLEEVAVIVESEQFLWFPLMPNALPDGGEVVGDNGATGVETYKGNAGAYAFMRAADRDHALADTTHFYVWVNDCSCTHELEDTMADGAAALDVQGSTAMMDPRVREEWVMRDDILEDDADDDPDPTDLDGILRVVFDDIASDVRAVEGQNIMDVDREGHVGLGK